MVAEPLQLVLAIVVGLLAIKTAILYALGRWWGSKRGPARRLGLAIVQGGEFAFVLFAAGVRASGVIEPATSPTCSTLAVTLSMAATPLLLLIDELLTAPRRAAMPRLRVPPEATAT